MWGSILCFLGKSSLIASSAPGVAEVLSGMHCDLLGQGLIKLTHFPYISSGYSCCLLASSQTPCNVMFLLWLYCTYSLALNLASVACKAHCTIQTKRICQFHMCKYKRVLLLHSQHDRIYFVCVLFTSFCLIWRCLEESWASSARKSMTNEQMTMSTW